MNGKTTLVILAAWVYLVSLPGSAADAGRPSAEELEECIKKKDAACVVGLIQKGADPNGKDAKGMTPLMFCAYRKDLKMAELLLKSGATADRQDADGMTALHVAAFLGCRELASILIENGASRDIRDSSGHLPSDYSEAEGHIAISEMLGRGKKGGGPKVYTNEDIAGLRDSGEMVISSFSGGPAPAPNMAVLEDGRPAGPKKSPAICGSAESRPAAGGVLLGVVGPGDVLEISCEPGKLVPLRFESEGGPEAEAFVSSQDAIQGMIRNKSTFNATVPGPDGTAQENTTVELYSARQAGPAGFMWRVWLSSSHRSRSDTVPCQKSGLAVLGLEGRVVVIREED